MIFHGSYQVTKEVATYIKAQIDTYTAAIGASNETTLPNVKYIGLGTDYEKKGRPQPFILVSPAAMDFDDDAYQGEVVSDLSIDCLISVDGYDSDIVLQQSMLYADALASLFFSDDQLGGICEHAKVTRSEYYPGGSGSRHYAIVSIAVTKETHR